MSFEAKPSLHSLTAEQQALISAQPIRRMDIGEVELCLLGTAHVSKASADAVQLLMNSEAFDAVAIELDAGRLQALDNPDAYKQMDLFRIIKEDHVGLVAANLALSAYQRSVAAESGVEPGAEMLAATTGARQLGLPLWLIDREVGLTLARCRASLGFFGGIKWMTELVLGTLFTTPEMGSQDVEKLKQGDVLQATFAQFAEDSPKLFESLIAERDRFMAAKLLQQCSAMPGPSKVLAIIGAGHMEGMHQTLSELVQQRAGHAQAQALIDQASQKPAPSIWPKLIGFGLIAILVGGLLWGFSKGFEVGAAFLKIYLTLTMSGTLIGALVAGARPLSALAATVAAPISVLHPAISSGMVSALVEVWLRKPTVADFEAIKSDLRNWTGVWSNRVMRVFLIFVLTNLGTSIGVWITSAWFIKKLS